MEILTFAAWSSNPCRLDILTPMTSFLAGQIKLFSQPKNSNNLKFLYLQKYSLSHQSPFLIAISNKNSRNEALHIKERKLLSRWRALKRTFFALGNKYETWNGDYFVHISATICQSTWSSFLVNPGRYWRIYLCSDYELHQTSFHCVCSQESLAHFPHNFQYVKELQFSIMSIPCMAVSSD